MRIRVVIAIIVGLVLIPHFAVAGDVVFIGHEQNPVVVLSRQEVRYIFLGQMREWSDGSKIVFAIQKEGATQERFLDGYIGKSSFQFSNYWKKQVFTGKCSQPRSFQNDQEMMKFVSETRGAIGYVSSDTNLKNVKTVRVK